VNVKDICNVIKYNSILFTFYSSKNPEKSFYISTKKSSIDTFNIDNNKKCFSNKHIMRIIWGKSALHFKRYSNRKQLFKINK